jgi:uncharacterized protein Smg (DUF494 family)
MNDTPSPDRVLRVLQRIAERLEAYLEGDDLAFETLGEALEQAEVSADDLNAALLVLRNVIDPVAELEEPGLAEGPGRHAQRVPSAEERESLTPEAWGFLLDLRRRGSLDADQFERVLEVLTLGEQPADVAMARDAAVRVVLHVDPGTDGSADVEVVH